MNPRARTPNLSTVMWMCVIVGAAFALYLVKYRVLEIKKEIAATEKQLNEERESLHVAAAEWAYLNRPDRLQQLTEKYLRLQPVKPTQIASSLEAMPAPGQGGAPPGQAALPVVQASMPTGGE